MQDVQSLFITGFFLYPCFMDFLRLFIALPLPDNVKTVLQTYQAQLKTNLDNPNIHWTTPEQWHLTLIFLGTTPSEKLKSIQQALESVARLEPFTLNTAKLGTFPSLQRPGVLWLGVEGHTDKLQKLHRQLSQSLSGHYEPDERGFKAHITLARIKQFGLGKEVAKALAATSAEAVSWQVDQVKLYSSLLKPSGPEYTQLYQVLLKNK
jgi:2'-5' RNA ligase